MNGCLAIVLVSKPVEFEILATPGIVFLIAAVRLVRVDAADADVGTDVGQPKRLRGRGALLRGLDEGVAFAATFIKFDVWVAIAPCG